MSDLELMDAISVQDVYVTGSIFEDAGDGMVRIIKYTKHNGVTVPVLSFVTPAAVIIREWEGALEFAYKILKGQAAIGSH